MSRGRASADRRLRRADNAGAATFARARSDPNTRIRSFVKSRTAVKHDWLSDAAHRSLQSGVINRSHWTALCVQIARARTAQSFSVGDASWTPILPPASSRDRERQPLGRVIAVNGSQARRSTIAARRPPRATAQATVGKFLGIVERRTPSIDRPRHRDRRAADASAAAAVSQRRALDLIGEIKPPAPRIPARRRRLSDASANPPMLMDERELRLIYGGADKDRAHDRRSAAGHLDRRQHQYRRPGQQAFRHSRHHRRRQVERRRDHPQRDPRRRGRTCASSWSIRTTNMAAASATRRRC